MSTKREYIINELMNEGFIENENSCICLEETIESGKSQLILQLLSNSNLSIKNVDNKKTELNFFKSGSKLGLSKRVDHIVFEKLQNDEWKLHLIEMKSTVGYGTWIDVKGKFRASYLVAQAIAAMLEMTIVKTYMYTTYEKVDLKLSDTKPSARRVHTGEKMIRPEEEWNGTEFRLNYGEKVKFEHIPIPMKRDESEILVGEYKNTN